MRRRGQPFHPLGENAVFPPEVAIANGLLVVPNDEDLYVLNAMTGDQLAKFTTGGTIAAGAAAIADGKIVVPSGLQYSLDSTCKNNNLIICYGLP